MRSMKNPIIYIVLNGELKMSPGKAAAQAVHAVLMLNANTKDDFVESYKRTVIVLEAKNGEQIKNLGEYLDEADIDYDWYVDEGVNEVDPYSVTALAAGVIDHDDVERREIFAGFPLYDGHIRVKGVNGWGDTEVIKVKNNTEIKSNWLFRLLKKASK